MNASEPIIEQIPDVMASSLKTSEVQDSAADDSVENRVRGWIRMGPDRDVEELTENNLGPIPAFLANPLTDVQQLEAEIVTSELGALPCPGLSGNTEFAERTSTNKVAYQTRRHEKAPFGVVTSRMAIEVQRDGINTESLDMALALRDFGTAAVSELPNHH